MNITFIGDVHGKLSEYKQIIDKCDFSICVGDFGFKDEWDIITPYIINSLPSYHKCVGGNHDYIPYIKDHPFSCGDYGWWNHHSIFTVRGADSIDKHLRIEGRDWFVNEELNYTEQLEAYDFYCKVKPRIVVSHDCPQSVMTSLFGYTEKSTTRQLLEAMFEVHKPDIWVFGHHHQSKDVNVLGTRFVCLAELEIMKLIL